MLENKIALVTGASRGIGKAIAIDLAAKGATVIGTATTAKGAAQITQDLANVATPGHGLEMNVTDNTSIQEVLTVIQKEFGTLAILVNNAGITQDNLLMRMKDEEWDRVLDTNLKAIYRLSKACLRGMMKAKWGRIINISSVVGVSGNAGQCNYAATKAGVIGFSKSLAQEIGSRGITVNVVAPGFIATDMTEGLSATQRETLLSQIPLGRLGQPQEIAHAVSFLAAEAANYITGQTLHVNGGLLMV